ncbi:hypothetical protein [Mycolicibacterium mengxianglii]|uniref:hypothetical protein n=1 Tax=Mycolicibacterium mengxianglii TaxID=2736649 RepID=UPI0018D1843B|nr:hypothetical protein [Mycolicibacterium mengxianglii]
MCTIGKQFTVALAGAIRRWGPGAENFDSTMGFRVQNPAGAAARPTADWRQNPM